MSISCAGQAQENPADSGQPSAVSTQVPAGQHIQVAVYFADSDRYASGVEPFETAVAREVLAAFFAGTTAE